MSEPSKDASSKTPTTNYVDSFKFRLDEIDKLQSTPYQIRDLALITLNNAAKQRLQNPASSIVNNGIAALKNISKGSIANNFKVIFSQMCVLAVSDLEATLKQYFIRAADAYTNLDPSNKKLQQIKVSLEELIASRLRFGGRVGQLIIEKDKPNFQNLKEIKEVFKTYFNKDVSLPPETEKNICFYLESRHVIVHKGGTVDEHFINATTIMDANIKNFKLGDRIEFDSSDWPRMRDSFLALVENVTRHD